MKKYITIGYLDLKILKSLRIKVKTNEVIITEERIKHIKNRHPNDYEKYCEYMMELINNPDFIIEANRTNSYMFLKNIAIDDIKTYAIVRIITNNDNEGYKNSIITFLKTNEKEWNRILRNKKILYKKNSNGII